MQVPIAKIFVLVFEPHNPVESAQGTRIIYSGQIDELDPHLAGYFPVHFQEVRSGTLADRIVE